MSTAIVAKDSDNDGNYDGKDDPPNDNDNDPFSPWKVREASLALESLRNTSLTIFNLSTKVDTEWQLQSQSQNSESDDKDRRYDLAYAILKHAHDEQPLASSKQQKRRHTLYHLALMEYYKLLRLDVFYPGAIQSVLLLLAILGYADHCLGLMDFLVKLQQRPTEKIAVVLPETTIEEEDWLEWVYPCWFQTDSSSMESLKERFKVLKEQQPQWCTNTVLVPYFLVVLRAIGNDDDKTFLKPAAEIGRSLEETSHLAVLRGLLPDSTREWDQEDAIQLWSGRIGHGARQELRAPRWQESCLLFWKILKDCFIEDERLHSNLQKTLSYMEEKSFPAMAEPTISLSLMDLLSTKTNQKLYCLHCRQQLSCPGGPSALRCSRCCSVHYCSRKCQKANYALHKERCKNIAGLRKTNAKAKANSNSNRYDLAYALVDLAYVSTDTIDRGRAIYELALVEYYQLLEVDFYHVGALESTLLLLAVLGFDHHLLGLVHFVLDRLEDNPREPISMIGNNNLFLECANKPIHMETISRLLQGQQQQWSCNSFFLPLLFWSAKKQSQQRKQEQRLSCARTSAQIGMALEASSKLPVVRGLLPDSIQRWGQDEAAELLAAAAANSNHHQQWQESCLLFWEILKDAFAFTPHVASALEETIETMEQFKVPAISEAGDLSEYAAWSSGGGMANEFR